MAENFLSAWMSYTSIYESPGSFWKWAAYSTISALLRDNCYLRQGNRLLFANIYVLLLTKSGGRKGPPVDLCETFLTKIAITKIISGRSSVQAILDELSRAETDKKTGKVTKAGAAIFVASEMAAGIVADPEALKILTDIYDYKTNPYKSRLRTGPCFNLDRIVFSILAASNEAMLKGIFGVAEIQGGFLARTFLIEPNETRSPNSLMRLDPAEREKGLLHVFELFDSIARLKGEFVLEEDAIVEYEHWYNSFSISYRTKQEVSGVTGRIHTGVIKVAMILAANACQLNITRVIMEQAIHDCISLIPNYHNFTMKQQKAEPEQAGGVVIAELLEARDHILSRKELIRKHCLTTSNYAELLDKITVTLESAGMIQQIQNKEGLYLKLTATCLEMLSSPNSQNGAGGGGSK